MTRIGDIARTGLEAAEARLANSAHNVANLNTPGFVPSRVQQEAEQGGGVRYRPAVREPAAPTYGRDGRLSGDSGTDLIQETIEQINVALTFRANLAVLDNDTELQRELLDSA